MVKPTIHEDDNDGMEQPSNQGVSNARSGSNGFSARQSPEKSGSTSPPSSEQNNGSRCQSYEELDAEARLRKILELLVEVDLVRLSDVLGSDGQKSTGSDSQPNTKTVHGLEPDTASGVSYNAGDKS